VIAPTAAPAPAAPPAAPAAPAQPAPLAAQVAGPMFSLASAGPGQHLVTVTVTPDTLGPVTVRAHVTADHVHVELFAPNDAGRDALRAILPDLRRDLAGSSGLATNLDLSAHDQAPGTGADPDRQGRAALQERATGSRAVADPGELAVPAPSRRHSASSLIDVLA